MAYTLQHTAESIDHKLGLIDENKNLLPYPYEYDGLPADFTDVGDGSFLTSERETGTVERISFKTFPLPVGEYDVNLFVVTIFDEVVANHGFKLFLLSEDGTKNVLFNNKVSIEGSEQAIVALLEIPSSFGANWLVKPQIVKAGEDSTTWVPNMDKIGTYVDRRFNSTNAKIKALAESLSTSGTGLPTKDAAGDDLISTEKYIPEYVNGEWVAVKVSVYNGETL
jgi:hypothetical protein